MGRLWSEASPPAVQKASRMLRALRIAALRPNGIIENWNAWEWSI
jgi:hypothetical protein